MFNQDTISELCKKYRAALLAEIEARRAAGKEESLWEIEGKNADERAKVRGALKAESEPHIEADEAEAERKVIDTEIGLTKAWLYSQSGR